MSGLEKVLGEARGLLADRQTIKSEAGYLTMVVIVRALEALLTGEPATPYPRKHHGEDDPSGLAPR
jgi:hypothetical protein